MAVNVSTRQLQAGDFVPLVQTVLAETGLPANRLELEITEASMITDADKVGAKLAALRALGVSVAIDDFGTGYSSLGYLKKFPVDRLKIDRSFVTDLPDSKDDMAITEAVIKLGHSLGMEVVAEGVETEAQADYLRSQGCDTVQGFYFSRPLPSQQLAALIATGRLVVT